MARLDWQAMETVALRDLRLMPDAFWALTPREFLLMAGIGSAAHLDGDGLKRLMATFPDNEDGQ